MTHPIHTLSRLFAAAMLVGGCSLGAAPTAATAADKTVHIAVHAVKTQPMPAVLRAGVFTFKSDPPDYAMRQWLADMRAGVVEIDIGESVFQLAENADDAEHRARQLIPLLARIYAAGGEPVLAITRIPIWLSSRPQALNTVDGDNVPIAAIVSPRNAEEWATLVGRVVGALRSGLGRTPDIKIGWEPDQSAWQASEADYFAFYRDTARGIKRADPKARVGGPGVSALYNGKGGEGASPLLPRFLRYCASTPMPDLGLARIPVDFVVWHQFGTDAALSWALAANQVRAWLKDTGYPASTDLMIGEWSSWLAWPSPQSPEQDQPSSAAYVVSSLLAMERAGIRHAAFTSLLEQREVEGQAFIGSFGLFTNQFIKKPAYWGFAALGKLGATRVDAHSSDPLVSAVAGRPNARELSLVVSTSTPGNRALLRTLIARMLASGVTLEQIQRELKLHQLEALLAGDIDAKALRLSPALALAAEAAATEVAPLYRSSQGVRGQMRAVRVDVSDWDLDGAQLEVWRVDSRHANAIAHSGRIGPLLRQRLQEEKQNLPQGLLRRVKERGYSDEHITMFKQTMEARNRDAALAERAPSERRAVRAIADEAQRFIHERLATIGQEINAWPELGFKSSGAARRTGQQIEFDMEADSVVLLRIVKP